MGVFGVFFLVILPLTGRDAAPIAFVVAWWAAYAWGAFVLLSGLRYEPGVAVGGGPLYPRLALRPDEQVLYEAPAFFTERFARRGPFPPTSGGHVFITNARLVLLPFRLYGSARTVILSDVGRLETALTGLGWPYPRQSITLHTNSDTILLRPWPAGPRWLVSWMGGVDPEAFLADFQYALSRAGWRAA